MATQFTPPKGPNQEQLKMNIDPKNYQVNVPSLDSIRQEWGLEDPQKYAETISNSNAQLKRDGIASQRDLVDQNLREGQQTMEVDFFNQFRQQREQGALRGLNAGIEQQRTTQLDMNRQAVMGNLLRDANREKQNLSREEARVEIERQAEELQIKNTELQRQIDLAFKKGDFLQAEASRRQQLDTQKELQRIESLKWSHQQATDNYWSDIEAGFSKQRIGLEEKSLSLQERQNQIQNEMDRKRLEMQRIAEANQQARHNSDLRMRQSEMNATKEAQVKQREYDKRNLIDKLELGIKNGSVSGGDAMTMLGEAFMDGVFDSRDGDYRDAVMRLNKTSYEYSK